MEKEKNIARYALEYALKKGCQQARVVLSTGEENEVEVRDGRVDKLHHSGGCQLSLNLFVDDSYSTISTNRLDRDEIERFIDKEIESRKRYLRSILNEGMRTREEVDVSNFLYLNVFLLTNYFRIMTLFFKFNNSLDIFSK